MFLQLIGLAKTAMTNKIIRNEKSMNLFMNCDT